MALWSWTTLHCRVSSSSSTISYLHLFRTCYNNVYFTWSCTYQATM